MKYIKIGLFLSSLSSFSQLFVGNDLSVSSGETLVLYTNEDLHNEGIITFIGQSDLVVDAGLDNRNGIINYNDVTLSIGSGTTRSNSTDSFYFKNRNAATQIGEQVRFVVLNKLGTTDVLEGHLGITDWFRSELGTLNGGRRVTLLNRSNSELAQVLPSTGGTALLETERFVPGRRAFRLISPSASTLGSIRNNWQEGASAWNDNPNPGFGTHITGLGQENPVPGTNDGTDGFDWQPSGNPSLFQYNNASGSWSAVQSTSPNNLVAGNPMRLMVRGSRDVDIRFNASAPSTTIIRENGLLARGQIIYNDATFGSEENDLILIGNPYHTVVDLEEVYNNSSNIKPFVAIWDPTLGGPPTVGQPGGRGAFVLVDILENDTNIASAMNKYLQPKQAAFFYTDGNGAPSIVFSESAKAPVQNPTAVFSSPAPHIGITLYDQEAYNTNDTPDDGLKIFFKAGADNALDQEDVLKIENQDENLARLFGAFLLSYETRDLPVDSEILPLFINQYATTDYVFTTNIVDLPLETKVYLRDNYLQTNTLLPSGASTHAFSVDPNIPASVAFTRFRLQFEVETLGNQDFDQVGFALYPNPVVHNEAWISAASLVGEKVAINIFDVVGKKVASYHEEVGANGQVHLSDITLTSGLYLVELTTESKKFTTKLIKK